MGDTALTVLIVILAAGGCLILGAVAQHYSEPEVPVRTRRRVKRTADACDACGERPGGLYLVLITHDDGPRAGESIYDRDSLLCRACAEGLTFHVDKAVDLCDLAVFQLKG